MHNNNNNKILTIYILQCKAAIITVLHRQIIYLLKDVWDLKVLDQQKKACLKKKYLKH